MRDAPPNHGVFRPFAVIKCRKCRTLLVADTGRYKTRKCPRCNHVNQLKKSVVLARFDNQAAAADALRYLKIPEEARDTIPYLRGTAMDRSMDQEYLSILLIRLAGRQNPDGIDRDSLLEMARQRGLDEKIFVQTLEKMRADGSVIQLPGHFLKIQVSRQR